MREDIRVIFFDATGTLIYLPRGVGWHYREIAARHGLHLDAAELDAAFASAFRAAIPRVATAGGREDDDKEWWRAVVRRVFESTARADAAAPAGVPHDTVFGPLFEELYAHFASPDVWALYPEVVEVLRALRSRYRLAILSNFDRRLYRVLDHLGIRTYFEKVFISSEIGAEKPDRQIFAAALAAMDVTPAHALHVGDDPRHDWQGAREAGLRVFELARPGVSLRGVLEAV
jgi:putative hydrolase of the HAD superfamily